MITLRIMEIARGARLAVMRDITFRRVRITKRLCSIARGFRRE